MAIKTTLEIQPAWEEREIEKNIWGPKLQEWRDVFEDYLTISRRRFNNKLSMLKLQTEITYDILEAQHFIKICKEILRDPSKVDEFSENEIDKENFYLKDIEKQMKQEKIIIKSLREIMDGHLWRIFNFNRALIYAMGNEPNPGYLTIDIGFVREFQNMGFSVKNKNISHFLLNDITNFARIGDVITRDNSGNIEIKEIKSTKSRRGQQRKKRLKKQEQKRLNLEKLANEGKGILQGREIKLVQSDVPRKSSLRQLEQALIQADSNGIGGRKINPYLAIICLDIEVIITKERPEKKFDQMFNQLIKPWSDKNDKWIFLDSFVRNTYSPNFTPLSIYPFSEKLIADLLAGKKAIFYYFNIDEFLRILEKNNWEVVWSILDLKEGFEPGKHPFCTVKYKRLNIDVNWYLMNQLIYDLLNFDSFLRLFKFIYKNEIKEMLFISFSNENMVWR